ncbi:MAG TPA: SDR family NAD(P)-dependent oxidoreductase, partial [Stellaceae bacterium]
LFEALGALYAQGAAVDWAGFDKPFTRRKRHIPTYPFQRKRFWVEQAPGQATAEGLPGRRVPLPLHNATLLETVYSTAALPFLADHIVKHEIVVPGACHLAHVLAALNDKSEGRIGVLEKVFFPHWLRLDAGAARQGQLAFDAEIDGIRTFRIASFDADAENCDIHATGRCMVSAAALPATEDLDRARQRCRRGFDVDALYQTLAHKGIALGPSFRWIAAIAGGEGEAVAHLMRPPALRGEVAPLHPGLIDGCFQALLATVERDVPGTFVPFAVEHLACRLGHLGHEFWCHAKLKAPPADGSASADLTLYDAAGAVVAAFAGLELRDIGDDSATVSPAISDMIYAVNWVAAPPAAPIAGMRRWLVLGDRGGFAAAVAARLRDRGDDCRLIAAADDIAAALASPLTDVLHLGALGDALPDQAEEIAPESWLGPSLAVTLVKNLARRTAVRLWIVTQGAVVADRSPVNPGQAPSFTLARVIAHEAPELDCVGIDLDPRLPLDADALVSVLGAPPSEPQVALRKGTRLVPRLKQYRARPVASPKRSTIRADVTYLVTGGLGGLGLRVADWLVAAGARRLVLLARKPPSPEARGAIARLAATGAHIAVRQADVADQHALHAVIEEIASGTMPLAGIVHAAGFVDDGLLTAQTRSRFAAVMAPKVAGTWNLHLETRASPLDFFVCFSSAAAPFGAAGQGSYAAGNAFMDALIEWRRAQGLPGLSVDWGLWGEIGMVSRLDAAHRNRIAAQGIGLIEPVAGIAALDHLLAEGATRAVVMPVDWNTLRRHARGADALLFDLEPAAAELRLGAPSGDRRARLVAFLRQELAAITGEAAVETRQRLFDLGLDSLMAVELKDRIERHLGVKLKATLLFDYPTLEALVEHLTAFRGEEKDEVQLAEVRPADNLDGLSREELGHRLDERLALIEQLIEGGTKA